MPQLVLLQTADLHNHIGLEKAGRLRTLRVENEALLLDCGDAIWAGNVFVKPGTEQAIRRMNEAGCDAMAVGNREYFFRAGGLLVKTVEAKFPVVSANLLPVKGDLGHVKRWVILDSARSDRVGVFGLTPLMVRPGSWFERFSDLRFISHERATKEALGALRDQCDWLVCLSHIGFPGDCEIAEEFGEIDVILGGHSHLSLDEPAVVNGVTISHIGPHGERAALLTSIEDKRPSGFRRELIGLP